jgi:hypothetical protein
MISADEPESSLAQDPELAAQQLVVWSRLEQQ